MEDIGSATPTTFSAEGELPGPYRLSGLVFVPMKGRLFDRDFGSLKGLLEKPRLRTGLRAVAHRGTRLPSVAGVAPGSIGC